MNHTAESTGLQWTGERYVPAIRGDIELEHLHRYYVVQALAAGQRVLDIACGEGYGSSILAEVATHVVGVDIAGECIEHARNTYRRSNLSFEVGSCDRIPLLDASIDLIVSFETIEHHALHVEMLAEFRRVLAPNGVVVISSPDKLNYSVKPSHHNPYHVKELERQEFEQLLREQFCHFAIYGQRIQYGSAIAPLGGESSRFEGYRRVDDAVVKASGLEEPVYLIAVASNSTLPKLSAGVFRADPPEYFVLAGKLEDELSARGRKIAELAEETVRRGQWALGLQEQFESALTMLNSARADLQDHDKKISDLVREIDTARQQGKLLQAQLGDARAALIERDKTISRLVPDLDAARQQGKLLQAQMGDARTALIERNKTISRLVPDLDAARQQGRQLQAQLKGSRGMLIERDQQIAGLDAENVRRGEWALRLQAELDAAHRTIVDLRTSTSWRLTYPLRAAKRILGLAPQLPAAARANSPSWRAMRWLSHKVPLGAYRREQIKSVFYRLFPAIFTHLPSYQLWHAKRGGVERRSEAPHRQEDARRLAHDSAFAVAVLPTSEAPLVSVVIPVYGQIDLTLKCLHSIAMHPPACQFEVIVVDDCSQDETPDLLKQVAGIRVEANLTNQGFIRSCNRGAQTARGEYLCFLNNDTEIQPRWLDELLATFSLFPNVGLVGSKLLYPNGTLQEAGGVLWRDGSAWNYGRGQDPGRPEYCYAREVDYCSGASILIRRDLFLDLGGFDEHYLPAYGEDSDLALKIRSRGQSVIYQPLSAVIHHEGATSGTDTSTGAKAHQVENARKLTLRWKDLLSTYQPPGEAIDRAKDRKHRFRVLVLDHCTPTPDQDAGSITALNLMLLLKHAGFQVTFIPEDNFLNLPHYTESLQRLGIEALYAPYLTSVNHHIQASGERYDLVLIFRPTVAERHLKQVRAACPRAKILYHTSDIHFLRMAREADLTGDPTTRKAANAMRRRELEVLQTADTIIVHSTVEKELLAKELPEATVVVFPWAIPVRGTHSAFNRRSDIAFVGGYQHPPNVDAAKYFINEIFPLVRRALPGVRFFVIGSNPPPDLRSMSGADVIVTDFVDDLAGLLDKIRVAVAPLRYGAGIKGKIATTLSLGLPSVATTIAIEGMNLTPEQEILVADTPVDFASEVVSLYQSEAQWHSLSRNGIEFAMKVFGSNAATSSVRQILASLGFPSDDLSPNIRLYAPSGSSTLEPLSPVFPDDLSADFSVDKSTIPGHQAGEQFTYSARLTTEQQIFGQKTVVHDLPPIFHYWSNQHLKPIFEDAGISSLPSYFACQLQLSASRCAVSNANFVSLGSGNCDIEISIAKELVALGNTDFTIECIELNPEMLDRGRKSAIDDGIAAHFLFTCDDLNHWKARKNYEGVFAHQSLHHVLDLEHLMDQVKAAMGENASFVISDIIGRNGHQRWPEALGMIDELWKDLPDSHKFNHALQRWEDRYMNWDCSSEGFEGIRAQDILPLLLSRFEVNVFVAFGNLIDIFVDRAFGPNFDPSMPSDTAFIDRVHTLDETALRNRTLTPTHMIAVMSKHPFFPQFFSRNLDPRACIHGEAS